MKVPCRKELGALNLALESDSDVNYYRILRYALSQWMRLSGQKTGIGFLRSRSFDQLYAYADSLVGQSYPTAALHFAANQLAALIRKYPWDSKLVRLDPEKAARETFLKAEHRCKRMNQWFLSFHNTPFDSRRIERSELALRLEKMRSWIRYVIRDEPDLPQIYSRCDFTGGASIGVHGNATNLGRKLLAPYWSVTPVARQYFAASLCYNFHYATRVASRNSLAQSLQVTEHDLLGTCRLADANKIAFVPKTAKTYRSIAVEPLGNGYLQKGTDLVLRSFLKRVGIDLSDQGLNQEMARKGSLIDSEESFCTIDLSSASDSISIGLCKEVLPPDWFNFLNCIRSPSYELDGTIYRSEKFCTMGNGFCFPLETLLFAAACQAVSAGRAGIDYMVYGDDIIVKKSCFDAVVSLLTRLGFRINRRKTFSSGPFRESCGSNWYMGQDVSPFTLDFKLDSLSSYFKFVNLARRNTSSSMFLSRSVLMLISRLPLRFQFWRPFIGPPDSGIDPLDYSEPKRFAWNLKLQCFTWLELSTHPIQDERRHPWWVVLAAALRGHPSEQLFTLRRKVRTRVRVISRSGSVRV